MQLGRYELLEKLASGGMGEIFRGRVTGVQGFEKDVAIKRIFPHLSADPASRELFIREAKLAGNLLHPNIVQVFELGESHGELFIVMELIRGVDLAQLVAALRRKGERLSSPVVTAIAFDLLAALEYAHGAGPGAHGRSSLIHGDISPSNVLLSTDGFVKVCDFGIAWAFDRDAAAPKLVRGKISYASPEQLGGQSVDHRTDVFSVGVVLHELICGNRLFAAEQPSAQLAHIRQGVANPLSVLPLPTQEAAFQEVIRPALAFQPDHRYANAAEFRDAVEAHLLRVGPIGARTALAEVVQRHYAGGGEAAPSQTASLREGGSQRWTKILTAATLEAGPVLATLPLASPGRTERLTKMARAGKAGWLALAVGIVAIAALGLGWASSASMGLRSLLGAWQRDVAGGAPPVDTSEPAPNSGAVAPGASEDPPPAPSPRRRAKNRQARDPARGMEVGFLNLNSRPWARVIIDGKRTGRTTPLLNFPLPPGLHVVRLETAKGRTKLVRIRLRPGEAITRFVALD